MRGMLPKSVPADAAESAYTGRGPVGRFRSSRSSSLYSRSARFLPTIHLSRFNSAPIILYP